MDLEAASGSKKSTTSAQTAPRSKSLKRFWRAPFSTADTLKMAEMVTEARSIWERACLHGRSKRGDIEILVEGARDLRAGDHQRRTKVVGNVVADRLQLVEQALDLVKHQIDGPRHFLNVVVSFPIGRRD